MEAQLDMYSVPQLERIRYMHRPRYAHVYKVYNLILHMCTCMCKHCICWITILLYCMHNYHCATLVLLALQWQEHANHNHDEINRYRSMNVQYKYQHSIKLWKRILELCQLIQCNLIWEALWCEANLRWEANV